MGYGEALEAAGATIIDGDVWGDYQGTWIYLVVYGGTLGYVSGWYGSCSYCDSYESFMDEYHSVWDADKQEYVQSDGFEEALASFGRDYLGNEDGSDLLTYEEILRENTGERWHGDMEAKEKEAWIRSTERYFLMPSLPLGGVSCDEHERGDDTNS